LPADNRVKALGGIQAGLKEMIDALGTTSKAEAQTSEEPKGSNTLDHAKALAQTGLDPVSIALQTGWVQVGNYWKFVGAGAKQ
jgi:hypothetical protein